MAKFKYTGGYDRYYPTTGLFANVGATFELDEAPDADWQPVDGPETAQPTVPVSQPATPVNGAVEAAEALLEANPALAEKLVKEVADSAQG